ncbi:hypothetical protein T484DRAFT_1781006, partial [Baffinella frigidus]
VDPEALTINLLKLGNSVCSVTCMLAIVDPEALTINLLKLGNSVCTVACMLVIVRIHFLSILHVRQKLFLSILHGACE